MESRKMSYFISRWGKKSLHSQYTLLVAVKCNVAAFKT